MKYMKKKWYFIIAFFIVIGIVGIQWNEEKQIKNRGFEIISNIDKVGNENNAEIELSTLVPFEWDEAYIFKPYIDKASIKKVMECNPKIYRVSVSDSDSQIYFVKDDKVVAGINGNYSDLGFYINYDFDDYYYKLDSASSIGIEMINGKKSICVIQ